MPQGFALEKAASLEIVAAYSAPQNHVLAVAASPGWQVLGAFHLPKSTTARVDAVMMVSNASLTSRVRLYDVTPGPMTPADRVVPGVASTQSTTTVRSLGPVVSLKGGHLYQLQCEVTGGVGDDLYGVVTSATITD